MTTVRWTPRQVPAELVERYLAEGFWNDRTLGSSLAAWLGKAPATEVHVHSRTRPYHATFADIDADARRLVSLLRSLDVAPGAVVAFQLPNWREALVTFAGLAMGGYVLVPIVHIYGRKEVGFILDQCGAQAYISPAAYGHVDYLDIVENSDLPGLRHHIVVDTRSWDALYDLEPATELPTVAPTDIAVLAYTSGTTSDPKGVIHDHRTLLAELDHITPWITPGKSNLMGSPVAHATGMLGAVLGPIETSSDIHLIDRWDPGHALEVMLEYGIGGGTGASVFLASLLDHPDFTPAHAANMGFIGLGGAPVPVALGLRAAEHGIAITRAYGSTEHPSTTGSRKDDPQRWRVYTDGPPRKGVEMRIVDLDGTDLPAGMAGEVWSRGPELSLGYTDPALTAAAFTDDGWYLTGDVGVIDADGCLTITDRVKDIVIRGGENLSAAEIELALETLPGVAEIAVVAAPDARLGEHACAVIRVRPDTEPITLADVTAHLEAGGLARQKWPEELRLVDDFPRTASGKIRKVDLRAWLRAEHEQAEHQQEGTS